MVTWPLVLPAAVASVLLSSDREVPISTAGVNARASHSPQSSAVWSTEPKGLRPSRMLTVERGGGTEKSILILDPLESKWALGT